MNGIGPLLELELRTWLTQLLCIWMLVQGPPLEAAQQRFHEKSLVVEPTVVGPAEGAPDAETDWSAAIGASFAQTAHSLAARWMTGWSALAAAGAAPERSAAAAGQPPQADLPLTDLPPGQVIPPPPQPPGAVAPVQSSSAPAPTRATDLANAAAEAAVVVAPAFNLLSISWQATNPAPVAVLTPIAAAVTKVYSYDACDPADKWKIYDPASPGSSDLAAITPAKGFWLDAVYPDGTDSRTAYDVLGRRIAETDQAGKTTQFGYDKLGRLTSVTDALNQVTSYTYDDLGNRVTQKDANGNVTAFEYGLEGRQTRRILPGGAFERFTYDANGNLKSRTDFKNVTTLYDYDNLNRLEKRTYPGGEQVAFTYTQTGRRRTAVDARGTTTYDYDDRNRLEALTYPDGRQLRYRYDDNGNRQELTAVVGDSTLTTSYTYDDLNRLETITDPEGGVAAHTYDENGNRATLQHPNGVSTTYTYDPLNRLKDLTAISALGAPITSFSYTLSPTGNRTRIVELDGTVKSYAYDDLYRLTSEVVTQGNAPRWSNSYVYDPVGNRKAQNRVEIGGTARTVAYTYDSRDRLVTEDTVNYGWDQNGNLISKSGPEGATYEWDFENRLKKATLADGATVEHTYDVDGTRIRTVTTPAGGSAQTVEYLVDTSGALSHVVAEGPSPSTVAAYYVRGDDLISVIRSQSNSLVTVSNYHADSLGSIRAMTDGAGRLATDTWLFEAFGTLAAHTGSDLNAYLFAGEILEPNIGWYFNRARWMDPRIGRFETIDSSSGSARRPASLNDFVYSEANPVNFVDPSGREANLATLTVGLQIRNILATATVLSIATACAASWAVTGTLDLAGVGHGAGGLCMQSGRNQYFRSTSRTAENNAFDETGFILSDAALEGYFETGSLMEGLSRGHAQHAEWIKDFNGDEFEYATAHSLWGTGLEIDFGRKRTLISVTKSYYKARQFAGAGGRVYSANLHPWEILPGYPRGTELEYLVRVGRKGFTTVP